MADVELLLQNVFRPNNANSKMTVDEDEDVNVCQSTDASLKKRAGDITPGDTVTHAGGTFTVVAPE